MVLAVVVQGCDMQCTRPIVLYRRDKPISNRFLTVPCGKCLNCRIAHSREWATRILHECNYHEDNLFLTLTFDDEHLPDDLSIHKKDLQDFFKRLRKDINPKKIKYYACGEYGERLGRPHYHSIIHGLGVNKNDKEIVKSNWLYGFCYFGSVTYDSARYVSDYIGKKYYGKFQKDKYGDKQPPFQLQSKGIGKQYCLDHKEQIISNQGITVRGNEVGIPRYYKKLLNIQTDIDYLMSTINNRKKLLEKLYFLGYSAYEEAYPILEQRDCTAHGRMSVRNHKL